MRRTSLSAPACLSSTLPLSIHVTPCLLLRKQIKDRSVSASWSVPRLTPNVTASRCMQQKGTRAITSLMWIQAPWQNTLECRREITSLKSMGWTWRISVTDRWWRWLRLCQMKHAFWSLPTQRITTVVPLQPKVRYICPFSSCNVFFYPVIYSVFLL